MFFNRYLPFDQYAQKHFEVLKKFDLKKHCSIDDGFVYFLDDFYDKINHIFVINESLYVTTKDLWCEKLSEMIKFKTKIDCKVDLIFDDQSDTYLTLKFKGYLVNYFDKNIDNISHLEAYNEELGNLILKLDNEYFGTGQKFLTELGTKTLKKQIFYNNFIKYVNQIESEIISDKISSRIVSEN